MQIREKKQQSGATCWPPHPSPFANYICLDALWSELWCEISIQAHSWRISVSLSAHTSQVWCGYTIKYVAGEDLREVWTEYSLFVNFRVRWIRVFGITEQKRWVKATALTASLRPGTERLLRLRPSSLWSDPGADRSISERLWSGAGREGRATNEEAAFQV